jgi:hypothetical protein
VIESIVSAAVLLPAEQRLAPAWVGGSDEPAVDLADAALSPEIRAFFEQVSQLQAELETLRASTTPSVPNLSNRLTIESPDAPLAEAKTPPAEPDTPPQPTSLAPHDGGIFKPPTDTPKLPSDDSLPRQDDVPL